jgi:flagella basal body P-ring formation protein FlgA
MKNFHRTLALPFAIGLVAGCLLIPRPCLADTPVALHGEAEVKRAVRLGDLFVGVPAELDRDIAQTPAPCRSAVYDANVLVKLAQKYRLDWQPQTPDDHVTVTTACTRISADMIRDKVAARIKEGGLSRDRSLDIAFDNRNLEIALPADQKVDFTFNNFTYDQIAKSFRAELNVATSSGPLVVPVTGRVTIKRNVPVLAHRLGMGDTVGASDLDWIELPEDRVNASVITEANQLVGREVRRDIAEGEMFHAHDVIAPRLVVRGSLVTLRIETPFMTITSQGKVQQDGAEGETVRVINTQSERMVEGTVTGAGVVEIRAARQIAAN